MPAASGAARPPGPACRRRRQRKFHRRPSRTRAPSPIGRAGQLGAKGALASQQATRQRGAVVCGWPARVAQQRQTNSLAAAPHCIEAHGGRVNEFASLHCTSRQASSSVCAYDFIGAEPTYTHIGALGLVRRQAVPGARLRAGAGGGQTDGGGRPAGAGPLCARYSRRSGGGALVALAGRLWRPPTNQKKHTLKPANKPLWCCGLQTRARARH